MTDFYSTINSKYGKSTVFTLFFSSILSQPLYFSYFIFFSPYLIKLLSFLSPLFITTLLLLISLLHTIIRENGGQGKNLKDGLEKLLWPSADDDLDQNFDQELMNFEEFHVYKIIFGEDSDLRSTEDGCSEENPVEKTYQIILEEKTKTLEEEDELGGGQERSEGGSEKMTPPIPSSEKQEEDHATATETAAGSIGSDAMGLSGSTTVSGEAENKQMDPVFEAEKGGNSHNESEGERENFSAPSGGREPFGLDSRNGSRRLARAPWDFDNGGDSGYFDAVSPNLGKSCGSMRKEKEWRRTLACKLFEERHNNKNSNMAEGEGTGEDGMDLLWETYETDLDKTKRGIKVMNKEIFGKKKDKKVESLLEYVKDDDDDDDDDDYGEEEGVEDENGQLCCLQALKFSAGKMNLGMKRPNLLKITKAFKGMGWLHQVTNKHSKKRVQPVK